MAGIGCMLHGVGRRSSNALAREFGEILMKNSKAVIFLVLGLFFSLPHFTSAPARRNNPMMPAQSPAAELGLRTGRAMPAIICYMIGIGFLISGRNPTDRLAAVSISITPEAAHFVKETFQARGYAANAGLRIMISGDPSHPCEVTFDTATTTGRDMARQVDGVLVLVAQTLALQMPPVVIDTVDGKLVCRPVDLAAVSISITPEAAHFVKETFRARGYAANAGVRIMISGDPARPWGVSFDTATDGGGDYLRHVDGVLVMIAQTLAIRMPAVVIEVEEGKLVCQRSERGTR